MKYIVYIFSVLISVACAQEIANDLDGVESFSVRIHTTMGAEKEFEVRLGTESFESLRTWISKNEKGWDSSLASYVPGIVVKYKNSHLNFTNTLVILNNESGQYIKKASVKDYGFLLQ